MPEPTRTIEPFRCPSCNEVLGATIYQNGTPLALLLGGVELPRLPHGAGCRFCHKPILWSGTFERLKQVVRENHAPCAEV